MNRTLVIGSFAALGLLLFACATDPDNKDPVAQSESALFSGSWTQLTSEEFLPVACPRGTVADAMECTGSNCDNVALHCGDIGRGASNPADAGPISEELPNNHVKCGPNRFMVGVKCSGSYCDNMSITCANFAETTRGSDLDCYWSPWFSEEQQYQYLLPGYAAAGIQCDGSYCDNISIYACPVVLN